MDLSSVKVGFIGAGNMAQAMAKGIMSAGKLSNRFWFFKISYYHLLQLSTNIFLADLLKSEQLWASAPSDGTLDVWQTWGCHTVNDNSNLLLSHLGSLMNLLFSIRYNFWYMWNHNPCCETSPFFHCCEWIEACPERWIRPHTTSYVCHGWHNYQHHWRSKTCLQHMK